MMPPTTTMVANDADDDGGQQAGPDDELAERAGQAGGIHAPECAPRVRQSPADGLSRVTACDSPSSAD